MKKSFLPALLLVSLSASLNAQEAKVDVKQASDAKAIISTEKREKPSASPQANETVKPPVDSKSDAAKTSNKPEVSPGWIVIEESWTHPLRHEFAAALHNARERYRSSHEKAAAVEIEKAISWLRFAQSHSDKATQEDLSTAIADLSDFAMQLKSGKPVKATQLDSAFAHASAALSKHHHFLAEKALAEGELKSAGGLLMTAADYLRDAARSANYEYGKEIEGIYTHYSPFGYWDETVVLEKSNIEASLDAVSNELQKLAVKLGAKN